MVVVGVDNQIFHTHHRYFTGEVMELITIVCIIVIDTLQKLICTANTKDIFEINRIQKGIIFLI